MSCINALAQSCKAEEDSAMLLAAKRLKIQQSASSMLASKSNS
jgi:hypothetical protein